MTYFDLSPLCRYTVGFGRLASLPGGAGPNRRRSGHPPYNIERTRDHDCRISMAVAGFGEDDVEVAQERNELRIRGGVGRRDGESDRQYLYQGIAPRSFERKFRLNDHVRVADARLEHGMLHVDLVKEIPEEMKQRRIPVRSGPAGGQPGTVESRPEAEAA